MDEQRDKEPFRSTTDWYQHKGIAACCRRPLRGFLSLLRAGVEANIAYRSHVGRVPLVVFVQARSRASVSLLQLCCLLCSIMLWHDPNLYFVSSMPVFQVYVDDACFGQTHARRDAPSLET